MSIVKLRSGSFLQDAGATEKGQKVLDKKVILVYCGKFNSMDGEVEIDEEKIDRLVSNHNEKLAKIQKLAEGEISLKDCPPIQLDHSTSARDTVGRLIGPISVGDYVNEDGKKLKAIYGTARILGEENVEKAQDGRWTNVSIGADLEDGVLSELSITPFPAAPNASLLKKNEELTATEYRKLFENTVKQAGAQGMVKHGSNSSTLEDIDSESAADKAAILLENAGFFKSVSVGKNTDDKTFYVLAIHASLDGQRLATGRIVGTHKMVPYTLQAIDKDQWIAVVNYGSRDEYLDQRFNDSSAAESAAKKAIEAWHRSNKGNSVGLSGVRMGRKKESFEGIAYTVESIDYPSGKKWIAIVHLPNGDKGIDGVRIDADAAGFAARKLIKRYKEGKLSAKGATMFEKLMAFLTGTKRLAEGDAVKEVAKMSDEEKAKMSEEAEKHEKLKKHLMDKEKMSAEDAEKKLGEMEDDEKSKLSAEADEKEKLAAAEVTEKEEKEKEAKMSAVREKITKLSSDMRSTSESSRLAAKKSKIMTKLARFQSEAKITPAEIKKLDLTALAKGDDATVEAVLKTYQAREPQVLTGLSGSTSALSVGKTHKRSRMSKMEADILEAMPFTRLAMGEDAAKDTVNVHIDTDPHTDMNEAHKVADQHMANAYASMDAGKPEEAKEHMKKLMEHCKKHMSNSVPEAANMEAADSEVSALEKNIEKMHTQNNELLKLVSELSGA